AAARLRATQFQQSPQRKLVSPAPHKESHLDKGKQTDDQGHDILPGGSETIDAELFGRDPRQFHWNRFESQAATISVEVIICIQHALHLLFPRRRAASLGSLWQG